MCSGSEAGSYLRLIDFVYHSTLGLRVMKKKKKTSAILAAEAGLPGVDQVLNSGRAASERRGNNLKRFKDLYLKTKAITWP